MSEFITVELLALPPWMARTVARLGAWYLLLLLAITVSKSATNALFLARADPARLPILYVVVAACVLLVTVLLGQALSRVTPARALTAATLVITVFYIASIFLVLVGAPLAESVLYVLAEVHATALNVLFWALVSDTLSPRNLRRAVGAISAAGMLGATLGGVIMGTLAEQVGLLFPMVIALTASAAALPFLAGLRSRSRRDLAGSRDRARKGPAFLEASTFLTSHRFVFAVAALVATLSALGASVDYIFRTSAAVSLSEDGMAALFGWLNAGVGVVLVVVQGSVTPRLLERLGIFWFVAMVPALILMLGGAYAAAGAGAHHLWVLILLKGVEMAGAFSLYNAAITLLYNPMPLRLRSQLRTLIDGAVKKGGAAAAGLLLGLTALSTNKSAGLVAMLALATFALLLLLPMKRWYLAALDERLGTRQRGRTAIHPIDPADRATREALVSATDDDEPERVLHALQALGAGFFLYPARVVKMLSHENERVREEALKHLPAREDPALTVLLLAAIDHETARRPREEAIRALARCAPQKEGEPSVAERYLEDEDPGAVCAAIEVCLQVSASPVSASSVSASSVSASSSPAAARARFDRWAAAASGLGPAWRRELARLIGRTDDARYDDVLSELLLDDEVSVRRLAILAAGREHHPAHLRPLVRALGDRQTRTYARLALVAYGDLATGPLSETLDDAKARMEVRIHIPRTLCAIGTDDAARALLYSNPKDDAYLQQRIADRLVELKSRRPELVLGPGRVATATERHLKLFQAYDLAQVEVGAIELPAGVHRQRALRFLLLALASRRDQNLQIAMQLLGLTHGIDRMMSAYRALTSNDEERRHDALELLDTELAGDLHRQHLLPLLVLPSLEGAPNKQTADVGRMRVVNLCRSPDPILRALARRSAAALDGVAFEDGPSFRAAADNLHEIEGEDMRADIVERLLFLENVDLFEGLGVDDLAAIAALCEEEERRPGERIYAAGDVGDCLYILAAGRVQLSREGKAILELAPGESLGQVSFLDRGPRPVDAHVSGPTVARLLRVERGIFLDLLTDRPGLMHAFFGVIAARLRVLIDRDLQAQ